MALRHLSHSRRSAVRILVILTAAFVMSLAIRLAGA